LQSFADVRSVVWRVIPYPDPEATDEHISQPELALTVTRGSRRSRSRSSWTPRASPTTSAGSACRSSPGGCSGFKYGLLIEDQAAEDDLVLEQDGYSVFVDPFSAQYISGVVDRLRDVDAGLGFTFKNPNATGGCGCGSSFAA
jgi:iron-sulfur cluster assembly protein